MDLVYIGKIVNTHGLKGELRILSTFSYKDLVFKIGNELYVDNKSYKINSYRVHKNYDMVTFLGFNDINEVLFLKGLDVYIDRKILGDKILLDDLINFKVISKKGDRGIVNDYVKGGKYDYISVLYNKKTYLIPYIDEFIASIDTFKKEVVINEIEGLIDEN